MFSFYFQEQEEKSVIINNAECSRSRPNPDWGHYYKAWGQNFGLEASLGLMGSTS